MKLKGGEVMFADGRVKLMDGEMIFVEETVKLTVGAGVISMPGSVTG